MLPEEACLQQQGLVHLLPRSQQGLVLSSEAQGSNKPVLSVLSLNKTANTGLPAKIFGGEMARCKMAGSKIVI